MRKKHSQGFASGRKVREDDYVMLGLFILRKTKSVIRYMCNFKKGEFKESYAKASRIPWQKVMGKRVQSRFPKKGNY